MRRPALVTAAAAGLPLLLPATARAHGLVGKQDLPIPRWLFAWAATAVLVVSFMALGAHWSKQRWQQTPERRVARLPVSIDVLCGAIGVAVFAVAIYAGLAGTQTASANLLPTVVYVLFWVGIPFASFVLGDVFRAFNPWLAIGRLAGWIMRRSGGDEPPKPLPYPERLGRWPAALGIVAFVWVELIYPDRDRPAALAALALLYAGVQLVGMSVYGVRAWSRNADPFGIYFGLFARLAPLRWTRRELYVRRPISGAAQLDAVPGTVALLCAMIGTTSFDGLTQGALWNAIVRPAQDLLVELGLTRGAAFQVLFTIGLLVVVLLVFGLYRAGIAGVRSVDRSRSAPELEAAFVHSLIPIALAYVIAHYFGLLAYQGQAIAYLASDPLGDGANLLGTASASIDYGWVSATAVWYVQVAALVAGHAAALTLAHDRALAIYPDTRRAVRSQQWMLAVMVGFTCIALWLLSSTG